MKPIRAIVLGSALLLPACTPHVDKTNNKTEIKIPVVQSKENLEKEFKVIREKEGAFAHSLDNWSGFQIGSAFLYLEIGTDDPAKKEFFNKTRENLRFVRSDFLDERIGVEKPDFRVNPNEKQVKLFIKALKEADKAALILEPYMKLPTNEIIEKHAKNLNKDTRKDYAGKTLREVAEYAFNYYKENLPKLAKAKTGLIQRIEKYNEDAKNAQVSSYEAKWGLSLDVLRSLKAIK